MELPMGRKARGRNLSNEQVRKLRDWILVILHRGVGLSVPDTLEVLSRAPMSEQNLRKRLHECPVREHDLISFMKAFRGPIDAA